jgi:pimeloyl-ACP methyl ester carboxylesterase
MTLCARWVWFCSVFCPDAAGRARSSHLVEPRNYSYPQYGSDAIAVFHGHFGFSCAHWIGTSMGGLLAMVLAANPACPLKSVNGCAVAPSLEPAWLHGCRLRLEKLVLNDVGPLVPKTAIERISTYVGLAPVGIGVRVYWNCGASLFSRHFWRVLKEFDGIEGVEDYLRKNYSGFGPAVGTCVF